MEVGKMFEADAQKADVNLYTRKKSTLDLITTQWVTLDAGRLMQVLINLITNGLKFTRKEDERTVTLTVGATRHRPTEDDLNVEFIATGIARDTLQLDSQWGSGADIFLHFSVTDTGCGFNDEQKGKIFERFLQASPKTHSKYGGSGLGLFISREMIELQGGEIGVRSNQLENNQLEKGATFAFYIAARVVQPPQAEVELTRRTTNPRRQNQNTTFSQIYTLLVVEDNVLNQKVFRMQLQKLGHEVHVVNHGAEALEFLEKTSCWAGNLNSAINLSAVLMNIEVSYGTG
ncbi:Hybrid signal transduction histidine kinase K [Fulvia fulva]|uniref:Hybrid signal transduction histidine kinase K n=1 Tax=Passalora fulva TaxID=5499 RepID=A0A9Q8LCT6_PASFU|nr:Hybrid signal transduction histidine kinase K [Fulvia fulva]KAK4629240.1 Hybrid signal transduction histidine kinase K [Fulvia fulva]KAK4630438.1 Hybrid signal transduction histidine kinase K [Fulvia fulva]UJO15042.1 Hybrid signal transduction histidine kinase K [Fulvia fulva]WPV12496.1 Hybrid signal transduction histidine kinase K [Fulvia fulva]WPV27282.1 Hybrid signal transduction histidine kinase K [Fulvia fulva]